MNRPVKAQFKDGPYDGCIFPFVDETKAKKVLHMHPPENKVHTYKRTTRRGNVHYYKYAYTITKLYPV